MLVSIPSMIISFKALCIIEIALIKISQEEDIFIGWFFSITDELNLYSNKIYEVTLKSCSNEN